MIIENWGRGLLRLVTALVETIAAFEPDKTVLKRETAAMRDRIAAPVD